ncbi:MAG TPA: hypothetical protein VFA89_11895 [Terriglobales bacterium]|nr:hypothetical protein [Terriglobales bacterium]
MLGLIRQLPVPKPITPKTHKLLDYLTIGAFGVIAGLCWGSKRRASIAAIANGAFILSYTLLTDYDGDGRRPVSFSTHGDLDVIQAGMAAIAPELLAFRDSGIAHVFRGQALNESAVIAMTDFDANEVKAGRRWFRRAA